MYNTGETHMSGSDIKWLLTFEHLLPAGRKETTMYTFLYIKAKKFFSERKTLMKDNDVHVMSFHALFNL
jgi:hypothetical protein